MSQPLLALLHLCDSLFPIGGFGYSDGLEAATATGLVHTPADLQAWLDVCLDEVVGRSDGPAALRAWFAFDRHDWEALSEVDEEITAMRPSSATRRSSKAMGLRLITTWSALHPDRRMEHLLDLARLQRLGPALPIAFGCACVSAGVGIRETGAAFAYTRLASTTSAALRLNDKIYREGKKVLSNLLEIPVPVIAAVNGAATVHSEYVLLADIVIATPDTVFQDKPHFALGIVPGDGIHSLWPEVIGSIRGRTFVLSQQILCAEEAKTLGVISEIVARDRLLDRAREIAGRIAALPPLTASYTRVALTQRLRRLVDESVGYGLALEGISAADVARSRAR